MAKRADGVTTRPAAWRQAALRRTFDGMGRAPRIDAPGWYHIGTRCVDAVQGFVADDDARIFLQILGRTVVRFGWTCVGYCVMSNHYHFIVETQDESLARGLHRVNTSFARDYNDRHERRGHLFSERYFAQRIEREAHLLESCRYVDLNPIRAGICADPAEWKRSSFRATAGLDRAPDFLDVDSTLALFGTNADAARSAYVRFVHLGIDAA
jgi:REP element-mobilizing transposase RayT